MCVISLLLSLACSLFEAGMLSDSIESDKNCISCTAQLLNIVILFCFHAFIGLGYGLPKGQDKDVIGPLGIPSLPSIQKKSEVQVRSTTSGSSGEQSDDDEAEGETDTTQNRDPTDAKRVRR